MRRVLFARALERNNFFDSAATAYARAADELRPARDWLLLRVAGNIMDSTRRGDVLRKVTLAAARPTRRMDRRTGARTIRRLTRHRGRSHRSAQR